MLIIILILVWKLSTQIWTYNLFLLNIRQSDICVDIEKWRLMSTGHETSSEEKLWELHASSWHYENYCQSLLKQFRVFCTVYHILPELRLRRIFLAVYFVDTNPPEERVKILLCGKELNDLPVYSQNIFKKSYIDRYMERPSATFCNGKNCN